MYNGWEVNVELTKEASRLPNLDSLNLDIDFLSTFHSELGCRFRWTAIHVIRSAKSAVLDRHILGPYESEHTQKGNY